MKNYDNIIMLRILSLKYTMAQDKVIFHIQTGMLDCGPINSESMSPKVGRHLYH